MDKSYPELLAELKQSGMSEPDAIREIHKRHPGLRRAWEKSRESGGDPTVAPPEPAPAADFKPINLDAIKKSIQKYRPKESESEQPATPPAAATGDDYFTLIRKHRQATGCSFQDAARHVNKTAPDAWRAMLEQANPGRDFTSKIKK